jgi:hypothetical protein
VQRPVAGLGGRQCSDFTPIFIGMHRNAPLSPMKEGARVHHSYGSYAPSAHGSYEHRNANPSTAATASCGAAGGAPTGRAPGPRPSASARRSRRAPPCTPPAARAWRPTRADRTSVPCAQGWQLWLGQQRSWVQHRAGSHGTAAVAGVWDQMAWRGSSESGREWPRGRWGPP